MKYCIGIIGRSCHKYHFCHDKSFVTTKICLPQQKFCHDKIFLSWQTQKFCHDKHTFVVTKDEFCHDEHMFIATNIFLSWQSFGCDKIMFAETKLLSWQNMCFVMTNMCFVMTNMCLSQQNLLQQKLCLWQLLPMIHLFINKIDTNTANMKNWQIHLFINKIDTNTANMKNWQRLKCSIHGCSRPVDHDVSLFALSPLC